MGQQTLPPGFRFSPTDEELVSYYLRFKALGKVYPQGTIADVDVYKFEPWDLPEKAAQPSKDQEWYFFSAQDRKYSHTARINRTTKKGYWKATGKDRKVYSGSSVIGLKKTLIYYEGRAPNGSRTNWIMHEYRLDEEFEKRENVVCAVVLCRIRKKGGPGPRNGEQYGAPISAESIDLEEEANMGKVDDAGDTGHWEAVESKGRGNAFNLRDQIEDWKLPGHMGSSYVASEHIGPANKETRLPKIEPDCVAPENVPDSKGTTELDSDLHAFFQSMSDAAHFDMVPSTYEHGGDTFPCHRQYMSMQDPSMLFDLDTLPFLPTLLEADGLLLQDYIVPAFDDESEMLREMSDLVNDGKVDVGSMGPNERVMLHAAYDAPLGGDYIELDDMKAPLTLRSPKHNSELGRHEEQQLCFKVESFEDPMHSQGLAPRRARLQIPASKERPKAAYNVLPQAEKCFHGGDTSRPLSRESYRNAGNNYFGSYSGTGDAPHVVESSTRSYLSKHMSTYAVSKHEMLPAQLCYASYTDGHDCVVTVNDPAVPSTPLASKGKCKIDADALTKLPASPIDLSSSSDLLTKSGRHINAGADAFKNIPAAPSSSPTKTSSSKVSKPDVEVLLVSQACDPKEEHANMSLLNRHSWKKPFRVLVSKAKRSTFGSRIIELENGVRAKFNDKLCALVKPAARVLPTEGNASLYNSLRQVILDTLCHLVAAVLIFFFLFWGSRVLVSYAFSVSV